ncbi:hypothetical protein [Bacillus paramycoides]|uniref:Transposase n=1 Tax=Bacillus paramycoides TaxID=2026194 RepID=A0ABU6MWT2_9BACI|nr:hypothetical protein [Bacillus paramycoides]MED0980305.1 hypothetical protein [Bacillus paramycoides]MED0985376.1 hypothetical protein [Bacillus paramycoides]MED1091712.1 hypothetical protein [Bacillus paramycoides]MED1104409.1 hypothetical protein [Bacillus paramycoides]
MGDENLKHLTLHGRGGYLSCFYKRVCLEKLRYFKNAKIAYKLATVLVPDYKPAFKALKGIKI